MPPSRLRSPLFLAAAALLLVAVLGLAWLGYSLYERHVLRTGLLALVDGTTSHLSETLAAGEEAGTLERLEERHAALGRARERFAALEGWRDAPLADAVQGYLEEAQALLRREIAVRRSREAVLHDANALAAHVAAARWRSSGWIDRAIELKRTMERAYFQYRLADGGLQKSLRTLPEARDRLAPLAAPSLLIDDGAISGARTRLAAASAALEARVAAARILPAPRS